MEEILKLIETVDPSNTKKLDEIDNLVWNYLHPSGGSYESRMEGIPAYCSSRDVLKAIRPEGWYFQTNPWYNGCGYNAGTFDEGIKFINADGLPTEELAELHAIIQAIEYERKTVDMKKIRP